MDHVTSLTAQALDDHDHSLEENDINNTPQRQNPRTKGANIANFL